MARFMDVHSDMQGISEEDLRKAHQRDLDEQGSESVRFIKAWADPSVGKVFCLSEGPDRHAVRRVHERAGHATDEIYEIGIEVE